MAKKEEIWKPIQHYEESYAISNLGQIKSIDRYVNSKIGKRLSRGVIKTPKLDKDGYAITSLYKNQKAKFISIHRLVATHFIPNPENKPQVNHIDGNKLNNCVNNLEWCTSIENIKHSWDKLGRNNLHSKGEKCNFSKLKLEDIHFIRTNYNKKTLNQIKLANMFGVSDSLISQIINNKIWQK